MQAKEAIRFICQTSCAVSVTVFLVLFFIYRDHTCRLVIDAKELIRSLMLDLLIGCNGGCYVA